MKNKKQAAPLERVQAASDALKRALRANRCTVMAVPQVSSDCGMVRAVLIGWLARRRGGGSYLTGQVQIVAEPDPHEQK